MTTQGLTSKDWKGFKDLLIKSNSEQLVRMYIDIDKERTKRSR